MYSWNNRHTRRRISHHVGRCVLLAALFATLLPAQHAWAQEGGTRIFLPLTATDNAAASTSQIIPGEYIVMFKEADAQAAAPAAISAVDQANSLLAQYGGELEEVYDAVQGYAVKNLSAESAVALANDPAVESVSPNQRIQLDPEEEGPVEELPAEAEAAVEANSADTTQTSATWGLDRIEQRDLPLDGNYRYYWRGTGVHVYIIDTGIKTFIRQQICVRNVFGIRLCHDTFPPLVEFAGRIGNGADFIKDGNGTEDCDGHGTHVAGTVAGKTFGVAKGATLHAVRVLDCAGNGTSATVIAGLNWVASHRVKPAVANASLGGAVNTAVDAAVKRLIKAGVTVVVAAGNSNSLACNQSPARVAAAITVGAVGSNDRRWVNTTTGSGSNYGSCVDIFAPGADIRSASYTSTNGVRVKTGTSMAAPHVTGAVALYLQVKPNSTPAQVRSVLIGAATRKTLSKLGTGSPNRMLFTLLFHAKDIYEPDGSRASAKSISIKGEEQFHNIYKAGEVDYMKFTPVAGRRYEIFTTNLSNGADTVLRLYDANGVLLKKDDDSGKGVASKITRTFSDSRTYYIRVNDFHSSHSHRGYEVVVRRYVASVAAAASEVVATANTDTVKVVAVNGLAPSAPLAAESSQGDEPLEDAAIAGDNKFEVGLEIAGGNGEAPDVTLFGESLPVRRDDGSGTVWVTVPSNIPAGAVKLVVSDSSGFVAPVEVTIPGASLPNLAVVATSVSPAIVADATAEVVAAEVVEPAVDEADVADPQSSAPDEVEVNGEAPVVVDQEKPMVAVEVANPADESLAATLNGEALAAEIEPGTNRLWITLPVGLSAGAHTIVVLNNQGQVGAVTVTVN